jgi:hypothetical protein
VFEIVGKGVGKSRFGRTRCNHIGQRKWRLLTETFVLSFVKIVQQSCRMSQPTVGCILVSGRVVVDYAKLFA